MKTRTKVIISVAALILVVVGFFGVRLLQSLREYQDKVAQTEFIHGDASDIPDGTYVGEYDVSIIYAKVEVRVENGAIADVRILEHRNGRGADAERIAGDIVAEQRLDVDVITGATNSSVVIKKAVDNALSGM